MPVAVMGVTLLVVVVMVVRMLVSMIFCHRLRDVQVHEVPVWCRVRMEMDMPTVAMGYTIHEGRE